MSAKAATALKQIAAPAAKGNGVIQRQCACGQHTPSGAQCEECGEKNRPPLQRRANGRGAPGAIPRIVQDVLRTSGHALDQADDGAEDRHQPPVRRQIAQGEAQLIEGKLVAARAFVRAPEYRHRLHSPGPRILADAGLKRA
jgi:hypothetical protein